eukprot:6982227-Pyramimonas_sp.AAC.1
MPRVETAGWECHRRGYSYPVNRPADLARLQEAQQEAGAIFLDAPATQGLIDPGAGSDIVGRRALDKESKVLAKHGLQFAPAPRAFKVPRSARGVCGEAKVVGTVMFLVFLGGILGMAGAA